MPTPAWLIPQLIVTSLLGKTEKTGYTLAKNLRLL